MSEITIPMIPYHRLPLIAVLVVCYTLAWETGRLVKQLKAGKRGLDQLHIQAYNRLRNPLFPLEGKIAAELMASTSGTDSDFVVKLIDVLPDDFEKFNEGAPLGAYTRQLNGYQWPIAMEIRRGRFLKSDVTPQALVPGQVTAWDVPLRDHDHVFKKGHRIMVQVQSSLFPLYDRNPQKYVPNIFFAKPGDYQKATQKVTLGGAQGSYIALPLVK